jgi:hypothetical protein
MKYRIFKKFHGKNSIGMDEFIYYVQRKSFWIWWTVDFYFSLAEAEAHIEHLKNPKDEIKYY